MTRAEVIKIGFFTLLLGAVGYGFFRLIGFEGISAGIASEAILVLVVCLWTISYLFRVVTGQMTFMEQRKRYRQEYEKITDEALQSKFDSMSDEDQLRLIQNIENDKKV